MPYQFQRVEIRAFDFHLMLAPLAGGTQPKAALNYLVDPNLYNQQYNAGTQTKTANLSFSPLNWRTLNFHHFWKYYQTIQPAGGGKYDFWKLQMPLIGKVNNPINLISGSPNVNGTAEASIFLSAIGWSTNLNISIAGQLTTPQLSEFVGKLSNKPAALFEIAGKQLTLPGLFEYLGSTVLSEVYEPKSIDAIKIKRQLIVCPFEATGPVAHYPAGQVGAKRISTADRASLHSIIQGIPVSFADVGNLENEKKFLLTQFHDGPDFALTYFDKGTLLFMQDTAIGGGAYRHTLQSKLDCLLTNIRNYLVITLDLYNFCLATANNPNLDAKTKALRSDLVFTVKAIPQSYSNHFCQSFHAKFTPIGKLK
jgi:hypothetical protein